MKAQAQSARPDHRPLVVALHCSGGTAGQWRALADRLGPEYRLLAPNLFGAPGGPVWMGETSFTLAEEARPVLREIDAHGGPVHLVGHSFGGALALHIASRRPRIVASLALYEPSAFHLLNDFGPAGRQALAEIEAVSSSMRVDYARGAWRHAAATFVTYWNGPGAWERMRPELQVEMVRYLAKAQLDFHALMHERAEDHVPRHLTVPVRLMHGEHAPFPTRVIAEQLAARLPDADLMTIRDAGHMGPLTHSEPVANAIAAHIRLSSTMTHARAA
jgi:pimeloyl-ACP methyl ester carboxylesterase